MALEIIKVVRRSFISFPLGEAPDVPGAVIAPIGAGVRSGFPVLDPPITQM
jgi:hypothetical protein